MVCYVRSAERKCASRRIASFCLLRCDLGVLDDTEFMPLLCDDADAFRRICLGNDFSSAFSLLVKAIPEEHRVRDFDETIVDAVCVNVLNFLSREIRKDALGLEVVGLASKRCAESCI